MIESPLFGAGYAALFGKDIRMKNKKWLRTAVFCAALAGLKQLVQQNIILQFFFVLRNAELGIEQIFGTQKFRFRQSAKGADVVL